MEEDSGVAFAGDCREVLQLVAMLDATIGSVFSSTRERSLTTRGVPSINSCSGDDGNALGLARTREPLMADDPCDVERLAERGHLCARPAT